MSALLNGRALDVHVYDRLSTEDAADYDKLKNALLKNFDMTERGFRKKFCYGRPERSETFIQFSTRLRSYLDKLLNMAKVVKSFVSVCDFITRDQFLVSCSRELYVHLKQKAFENLSLNIFYSNHIHIYTVKYNTDNLGLERKLRES